MKDIPQIYDIGKDEMRSATQADIDRLQTVASVYSLTRRIILRMVSFPQFVPTTAEDLKQHHVLLEKMLSLIENGHIEG